MLAGCCAVTCIAALLTIAGELVWGQDHFLLGRNAATELDVRLHPLSADVTLTTYSVTNPYFASEGHGWMFFHFRGDVLRHTHSSQATIKSTRYFIFGRREWIYGGKVIEAWYWLDLPGFLPLVALGTALGALWSHRKAERLVGARAGFPVDVVRQDFPEE
jgi:hypothetical protein